jgi:3-hydroxyisobutyrate dehydrogenase-like beta-hydroxyacid dehydrogenase
MSERGIARLGFVGLGLMGGHMARRLAEAGHEVRVHNRTQSKAQAHAAAHGTQTEESPAQVAAAVGAGIVFVCVADTPALEAVVEGTPGMAGLIDALAPGAVVVDMGTSRVETTRRLAKLIRDMGATYVDAPVSGGEVGARDGTLTIMAGGDAEDLERIAPCFEAMGRSWTHVGPVGAGQVAKAANQLIVGLGLAAVAEALLLAEAGGADPARTREALLGGFAGSRILDLHGQRMLDRSFEPGGRARTQLKDLDQTMELAGQLGITLPLLAAGTGMWREMVERGWGDLDQSGIAKVPRVLSGRDE